MRNQAKFLVDTANDLANKLDSTGFGAEAAVYHTLSEKLVNNQGRVNKRLCRKVCPLVRAFSTPANTLCFVVTLLAVTQPIQIMPTF